MKKFIKICSFVLCLATIFLLSFQFGCDKYGKAEYRISEDGSYYYVVGAKDKKNSKIEICGEVDGLPVKYVADYAFKNCDNLTDVQIQEGVKSIGVGSFQGCSNLKNINIPNSLEIIDMEAFYGCSSLEIITFNDSNLTAIGDMAFEDCKSLKNVTLPKLLTKINERVFYGCENLTDVQIQEGVKNIEFGAFQMCSNLKNINIPASLEKISAKAFSECSSLETINFNECNLTEVGERAFEKCDSLNSVVLPKELTKISEGMFYGCEKLSNVTFPSVDFSIEEKAFWFCGFEKIVIGKNVVGIKSGAFSRNYNLNEFVVDNENEYYTAIDGNLYSKDGKTFMFYALRKSMGENGAESFTISSDVNKILPYAFYDEDGRIVLKQVYLDGASGWKLNGENAQILVNNSFQMAGNLRYTYADGEWTR